MAGVFAVLAAFLIVHNLHRAYQAEQNRWFKKQNWIYGPPNERTKNDPVQPYGWEFDRYQEAEIHLRPLRDTQRFSLSFRLQLRGFDRLNFRLLGEPFSADLLVWGQNLPADVPRGRGALPRSRGAVLRRSQNR